MMEGGDTRQVDDQNPLGKLPDLPLRKYDVVLVNGDPDPDVTVEAQGCVVIDGSLCFLDAGGEVMRSWAPGEWHSMARQP